MKAAVGMSSRAMLPAGLGSRGAELRDRPAPQPVQGWAAKPSTFDVAPRKESRGGRSTAHEGRFQTGHLANDLHHTLAKSDPSPRPSFCKHVGMAFRQVKTFCPISSRHNSEVLRSRTAPPSSPLPNPGRDLELPLRVITTG